MPESTIKRGQWFRPLPEPQPESARSALIKALIGAAIGGIAFVLGATTLAVFIWVVAATIGIVTFGSQKARSGVGRFFAALGRGLGWLLGMLLLAPLYLVGFTAARMVGRLAGRDPLHLRDKESQTFWLPVDSDRRKVRHIRSLFATETLLPSRGTGVVALASIAGLLIVSELMLRFLGFGSPILYQADARAGFFPGPNQNVVRYGGRIETNAYGMRAPDFAPEKADGAFRILMIGDSTLWGGSYVDQPDLYARRLERALQQTDGTGRVEVLNIGVNAWGPFNKLGYIESFGAFDADVAIICLPIGDIYRKLALLSGVPFFPTYAPPRLALEEVLHHLNWRSREWGRGAPKTQDRLAQGEKGIAAYVELAKRLREQGCEVLVEVLPSPTAGTTDRVPTEEKEAVTKLTEALQDAGFSVGFPAGVFQQSGTAEELYYDHVHLNASGHKQYASYLESRLQERSEAFRAWARDRQVAAQGGADSR